MIEDEAEQKYIDEQRRKRSKEDSKFTNQKSKGKSSK